jgi:4-amino-4-deoxy-L-arabinose transferase-like glycosyltransferase
MSAVRERRWFDAGTAGRRPRRLIVLCVLVLYAALASATAYTRRPWSDEGWFASPALNLATHGFMGTTVLEPNEWQRGIDRYTYWVVPLYLVTQAGWYKLVGFSLFKLRVLSLLFGLLALSALYTIVKELSGQRAVALLAFVLLAFDYVFIMGSSFGRMDLMCAALGLAGLAAYLRYHERNLSLAVLLGHTLVAASGLTHYWGILYFCALLFLTFYFDRAKLQWPHLAIAALPYLVGATAWGLYILKDPALFLTQFRGNATHSGRLGVITSPLAALKAEITRRYLVAYGLGPHSLGTPAPVALKILIPVAYLIGLVGTLCSREIRRQRGTRALIVILAVFFVIMTLFDGQKLSYYLLHVIPLYVAILAVWLYHSWTTRTLPRWLLGACVVGLLLLETGGVLLKARTDLYHKSYLPAVQFLQRTGPPDALVMGSAELGFGLGFDRRFIDDNQLGHLSDKRPDFIVVEEIYEEAFRGHQAQRPQVYEHVMQTLTERYRLVYDQDFYKIYARRDDKAVPRGQGSEGPNR